MRKSTNSEKSEGIAFDVDDELKYQLLIDIDSLFFELNSLCELMNRFFEKLHCLAEKPMPKKHPGLSIKSILGTAG